MHFIISAAYVFQSCWRVYFSPYESPSQTQWCHCHFKVVWYTSVFFSNGCVYKLLPRLPYSFDVAPFNCYSSHRWKDMHNTQFSCDSDIIQSVENFTRRHDEVFFETGIQKLHKWSNRPECIEVRWDYVEKNKLVTIVVSCLFIFEARNFRVTACIASACVLWRAKSVAD